MFNWVEFRAVWRIVHYKDSLADTTGEVDKILLDNVMSARVGAPAVTEYHEKVSFGVEGLKMVVPDPFDVVAYEFRRIVACAEGKVSRVVGDVVDAVRYNRPRREGRKVMV